MLHIIAALTLILMCSPVSALTSWVEQRDQGVVKQQRDYSCGAAAVATLLTHHWGREVSESDVLDAWLAQFSQEELSLQTFVDEGFSLWHIAMMGEPLGYRAAGLQVPIASLAVLKQPLLIYIEPFGQPHFTLVTEGSEQGVWLSDPSWGRVYVSLFELRDWIDGDAVKALWLKPTT
jgi:predicted double-glycine peptidase